MAKNSEKAIKILANNTRTLKELTSALKLLIVIDEYSLN